MARTIKVTVSTDKVGSDSETEFTIEEEDGATPLTVEEIEVLAKEAMFEMIEWGWEEVEEE